MARIWPPRHRRRARAAWPTMWIFLADRIRCCRSCRRPTCSCCRRPRRASALPLSRPWRAKSPSSHRGSAGCREGLKTASAVFPTRWTISRAWRDRRCACSPTVRCTTVWLKRGAGRRTSDSATRISCRCTRRTTKRFSRGLRERGDRRRSSRSGLAPRGPGEPSEEQNHDDRRNERSPPRRQAERRQRSRSGLHEQHDGPGPREGADQVEHAELHRPDVRVGARDRNRRPQARQEPADEDDGGFMRMDALADRVAVLGEPRVPIQPVKVAAEDVKPQLVAGRPAERARDQHAHPEQLADHRIRADLAVVDLAFDDRCDVNRQVGEHYAVDCARTPRTTRATRAVCSSVSEEYTGICIAWAARCAPGAPAGSTGAPANKSRSLQTSTCSVSISIPHRTHLTTSSSRCGPYTQY